ncbi:hypothetical protein FKM82_018168 [Ascaphus truei]
MTSLQPLTPITSHICTLTNLGITDTALSSYLSHRSDYISFNNSSSLPTSIQMGMPQSSVFGPLFPLDCTLFDLISSHGFNVNLFALYI